jgi:uncharacterized metal-binding protein YceD (DUF177 family)
MKKVKMLKTMACAVMTAQEGQILNLEDDFANQLVKAGACEVLEHIIDVVDYEEVKEEEAIVAIPVSELSDEQKEGIDEYTDAVAKEEVETEVELETEVKKFDKKRK